MIELIAFVVSLVTIAVWLAVCTIVQPSKASCPTGWSVATLRPSGYFACSRIPPPDVCNTRDGCVGGATGIEIRSRIHCTGGAVPITNDGHTVGCQRIAR